jgi:hypothetical protein
MTYGPFSLWNRPLELNDYSYKIIILLFGRNLFLRITWNNYSLTYKDEYFFSFFFFEKNEEEYLFL